MLRLHELSEQAAILEDRAGTWDGASGRTGVTLAEVGEELGWLAGGVVQAVDDACVAASESVSFSNRLCSRHTFEAGSFCQS